MLDSFIEPLKKKKKEQTDLCTYQSLFLLTKLNLSKTLTLCLELISYYAAWFKNS